MRDGPTPEEPEAAPGPEAIREALERILASAQFANAPSLAKMLRFVVAHALDGTADRLKEYTLGVEVFDRGGDFDPRQDTIVRVQARRLRERLAEYYAASGAGDPVRIRLPTGHYVPTFESASEAPSPAAPSLPPRHRRVTVLALALGLVALVALAVVFWPKEEATKTAAPTAAETPHRIAVLPFTDLSQARDQEYLADGLAEEIINQLAQVPALQVIGRTSSFSFKGRNEDMRDIGRKLDVSHLLEGSVRRDGDRLRITTQLIRADDASHIWSKTYARELRDVFAVQDEIARDVAQAMSVKLDAVAYNRAQGGTTNVEAYERLLRYRSSLMRELWDLEHARERLQLAREMVALDPQCVLCWDKVARSLETVASHLDDSQAQRLRAEAMQVRAHIGRIAPDSWLAKIDRANALWREGKRAEAIALAKEVAESGPATWERMGDYAWMLFAVGHLDETVALVERARAIEPRALFMSRDLQFDYLAARRHAEAEAEYQRGLQLEGSQVNPDFVAFIRQLAGKRPGGLTDLRKRHARLLQQLEHEKGVGVQSFRDLGRALGDRDAMLAVTRRAMVDEAYGGDIGGWANVADALGDANLAVAVLRKQLESAEGFKEGTMTQYPYYAFWTIPYSSVRSHPDFKKLLIETGVADYWRQTGKWGDGCEPVGDNDFRCK